MKNLMFVLVVAMLISTVQAGVLYENFETTGDQYTLFGSAVVAGGYLNVPTDWHGGAVLDGEYPASVSDPSIKTTTFNFLGNDYQWTTVGYLIGTNGLGTMETHHGMPWGWLIRYMPNDNGMIRFYHNTDTRTEIARGNYPMPGGFDLNADYELVVEDSGTSVTFWVQNAANPTINTGQLTFDTSSARYGDQDAMIFADMDVPAQGGGFDDVTIIPEPTTIGLLGLGGLLLRRKRR